VVREIMSVADKFGLVVENSYLTVYIPATNSTLVFRVISRSNRGFEVFDYGPLPLRSGDTLTTFVGGTTTVPADGVLPAMSFTGDLRFPAIPGTALVNVRDTSDIWYFDKDDRDRLFHVKMYVYPPVIRIHVRIPTNVTQYRFQKDRVALGIDAPLGFSRGTLEVVHIPYLIYGYRFANDTNLDLRTYVRFLFGEYVVEIPRDPDLIFDILARRVPSYWITMPIASLEPAIRSALSDVYGFRDPYWGFRLYRSDEKSRREAVREYSEVLKMIKV
jgi:hypothetical protein